MCKSLRVWVGRSFGDEEGGNTEAFGCIDRLQTNFKLLGMRRGSECILRTSTHG